VLSRKDPKPETRNPKPETRNLKPETLHLQDAHVLSRKDNVSDGACWVLRCAPPL
jgi:hypothetical protein